MTGQGTWRGWTLKQPEAEMNQKGQEKHQKEMDAWVADKQETES